MKTKLRSTLAIVATLSLVGAACGDDDEEAAPDATDAAHPGRHYGAR